VNVEHKDLVFQDMGIGNRAAAAQMGRSAYLSGGSALKQLMFWDIVGSSPPPVEANHQIWGLMYWYLVCPLHQRVFSGMLRGIACAADHRSGIP
jgi:hypothetical protein